MNIYKHITYLLWKIESKMFKKEYKNEKIEIGENVSIHLKARIYSNVKIGRYTYVGENTILENCEIGAFCSIARDVKIGLSDHKIDMVTTHPIIYKKNYRFIKENIPCVQKEQIKIGNDVWIGAGAQIMNGIKIGDGVIVAAGAIVTKNIEDYAIVGGVPAKFLKYRFNKEQIVRLQELKWWQWSEKEIEKEISNFYNIEKFCAIKNKNL